jgi:predicted 2-oxoglutarate/Fe(II)-dependent dioxygenase YbiX
MPGICEELAELLSTVQRPGDFFASGRLELQTPRLTVDGVGQIAFPLLPVQAAQLIAAADRAPYGRGEATIVDTDVRRTWQIGPDRVHVGGKYWQATLDRAVALAADGLGVDESVAAVLYKLLVYDEGSFFLSHRDTEKEPNMFATLVLALPSTSSGGELVVRHRHREVKLDLSNDDPSEMTFAAFYADCVHEVLPVTAGCRAALVYNLIRTGKVGALTPPDHQVETARAATLLQKWENSKTGNEDDVPEKVIYPLGHAYSLAELDFAKLKGADSAVAAVLRTAASQAKCDLHLALLSIEESGAAEYNGSYRGRYRGYDDEEFEAGEVLDRSALLTEWRGADGKPLTLGEIPIEEGEVSPPDALEDIDPDEEHFHEATGNEGASFERTYRCAALVLWPQRRRLAVLNQAGLAATQPYLESLATNWIDEGAQPDSTLWMEAHELSGYVLDTWPQAGWYGHGDDDEEGENGAGMQGRKRSELARFLTTLTTLKDVTRIEAALALLTSRHGHDKSENAAILAAVALFPMERAAQLIEAIIVSHATDALAPCCALLRAAMAGSFMAEPERLTTAAAGLIASLPGDPARAPVDQWGRRRHVLPGAGIIADLVRIAEVFDTEQANRLARHLLAWPKAYDIDRALIPAVKRLLGRGGQRSGTVMSDLIAACLGHIEKRVAEPLKAPENWTRASNIRCSCEPCAALRRFLANPTTEAWTLKARAEIRSHVEGEIRTAGADLDIRTVRHGSPHTLVCQKNRASYQRRVAQRREDLADIAILKGTEDTTTS